MSGIARRWAPRTAHHASALRLCSSTVQCRNVLLRPARVSMVLALPAARRSFWSLNPTRPAAPPVSSVAATADPLPPVSEASFDPGTIIPDSTLPDALAAAIPPLQFGDLSHLGLACWYTPAGLIRESFELINVATGLPWFWTIIAGTVFWRIVVFPFVLESTRNSARLLPMTPRLLAIREDMNAASKSGDKMAVQRTALKQKKIYEDAGVSMGRMFVTPFVQLPVSLGLFFGVKKMCEYPVQQLKESGMALLPDLTVADPTYILPVLAMVAVNVQITLGAREMNMAERPEMGHLMNGLRILTLMGAYVMASFPSGLMLSLLVTSTTTFLQSLALQNPSIRAFLRVPIVPKHLQGRLPTFPESVRWVKQWWLNKMEDAKRQADVERKARMRHRR